MGENLVPAIPFNDIERMGRAISMSKLFGLQTPEQAVALMLIAQAEGLHPAIAARDYHIIQGRPALKADAMLSRFQAAGGKVQWTELTDKKVSAIFSHAQGGSVEIDWTIERAKQAELGTKEMWRKYPRQMLRARVISEGIRTVYPGCLVGFYTPEEVIDMEPMPVLKVEPPEPAVKMMTLEQAKKLKEMMLAMEYPKEQILNVLSLKANRELHKITDLTEEEGKAIAKQLEDDFAMNNAERPKDGEAGGE